jgi:hypothetical protein
MQCEHFGTVTNDAMTDGTGDVGDFVFEDNAHIAIRNL